MNDSTIDLKPCPFCGQQAIRVSNPGHNWDGSEPKYVNIGALHNTWYVGCPSTFFEGQVKHCEIHPSASWYASLSDAINAWNNREE